MAKITPPPEGSSESSPIDRVLIALGRSETLEMLGMGQADLQLARYDSDLFQTLQITHEFLVELGEAGVLNTFLALPPGDRADFVRRIGMTDDPQVRLRRIATLISALREAPLDAGEFSIESVDFGEADSG